MLPWFNLDLGRELDFFSKDGVPCWVQFGMDMEALPTARVVVFSPPDQGVTDGGVVQKACGCRCTVEAFALEHLNHV